VVEKSADNGDRSVAWSGRSIVAVFLFFISENGCQPLHPQVVPPIFPSARFFSSALRLAGRRKLFYIVLNIFCQPLGWPCPSPDFLEPKGPIELKTAGNGMLIIADAHVDEAFDNTVDFFDMLVHIARTRHDVVFLGDTFDLWIGLRRYENALHRRFMQWCRKEKKNGFYGS
jgi:hypothetical protein